METLDLGFNLGIEDTSFLNRMIRGGSSDDLTPRSGDISFDDHTDYRVSSVDLSQVPEEVASIIKSIRSIN